MKYASHLREYWPSAGLICICVLTLSIGSAVLLAQNTLPAGRQLPPPPIPAPKPAFTLAPAPAPLDLDAVPAGDSSSASPRRMHGSHGAGHDRTAPPSASNGFSLWDRTLLDAMQHGNGARFDRSYTHGGRPGYSQAGVGSWGAESGSMRAGSNPWNEDPANLESLFQGSSRPGFGRSRGAGGAGQGMNGGRGSTPGELKLDQLTKGDLGMYLKSSVGSFRLSYQDALSAKNNGRGSGVGPGSAGASFTSSSFGNGMFNLSANSTFGASSTASSSRGGFSAGPMSGPGRGGQFNPGSTEKHSAASVSLHLHF